MKEYKVIITPKANEELEAIRKYIIKTFADILAADKLKLQILQEINSLNLFPQRYRIFNVTYRLPKNIHVTFVNRYAIMYIIDEERSLVLVEKICLTNKNWKA